MHTTRTKHITMKTKAATTKSNVTAKNLRDLATRSNPLGGVRKNEELMK